MINKRVEKILDHLNKNDSQIKALKAKKAQLFQNADETTKDALLEYEELESIELCIITKVIYKQAIKDILRKIK